MSFKTNGRENSNVHSFLLDLHNNASTFFKIFRTLLEGLLGHPENLQCFAFVAHYYSDRAVGTKGAGGQGVICPIPQIFTEL